MLLIYEETLDQQLQELRAKLRSVKTEEKTKGESEKEKKS